MKTMITISKENFDLIISKLQQIGNDCGDALDRTGEYTSDKIREVIKLLEIKTNH